MNQLDKFDNPDNLGQVKACVGNTARKRTKQETKRQKAKALRYVYYYYRYLLFVGKCF